MKILVVDAGVANIGAAVMETRDICWVPNHVGPCGIECRGWMPAEVLLFTTQANPRKLRIRASDDDMARVMDGARQLGEVVRRHDIRRMVCEVSAGMGRSYNATKFMLLGNAIVASVAGIFDLAYENYSAREGKLAACGKPDASKAEVQAAVEARWPGCLDAFPQKARREHPADALACFMAALKAGNLTRL